MVEDGNTENKTDDTTGQEGTPNPDPIPTPDPTPNKGSEGTSELDRAEAINKEKARLQEEDKKLIERKEKLQAVQMVGGHTVAGQPGSNQEPSKEEKKKAQASKFFEGTALGDAIDKTK